MACAIKIRLSTLIVFHWVYEIDILIDLAISQTAINILINYSQKYICVGVFSESPFVVVRFVFRMSPHSVHVVFKTCHSNI